jgi:hypothetical protein
MVVDIIINAVYGLLTLIIWPITQLADVSLPSGVASAFTTARSYLQAIDILMPYATLLTIIGLVVAIELAILTYKLIYWIIKRIPTQS